MREKLLLLHKIINPAPKELVEHIFSGAFSPDDLQKFGISRKRAEKLRDSELLKNLKSQLEKAGREGWRVLFYDDDEYPGVLREISHPPVLIFVRGTIECPCFAVVGTRRASQYGRGIAHDFSRKIASSGITVVSGLAYGIDTKAHIGALEAGRTIAVLGSGAFHIYPSSNRSLARKISEKGALITEFFPEERPAKFRFPLRNRIIAGISFGVLVVEAPEKSGALITARLALEYGRDVFAVPGDIGRKNSRGTNRLIQEGAKLVLSVEDIIGEYAEKEVELTEEEEFLLQFIPSGEGVDAEFLSEASGLSPERIFPLLLSLEMKGVIIGISGWRYRRIV